MIMTMTTTTIIILMLFSIMSYAIGITNDSSPIEASTISSYDTDNNNNHHNNNFESTTFSSLFLRRELQQQQANLFDYNKEAYYTANLASEDDIASKLSWQGKIGLGFAFLVVLFMLLGYFHWYFNHKYSLETERAISTYVEARRESGIAQIELQEDAIVVKRRLRLIRQVDKQKYLVKESDILTEDELTVYLKKQQQFKQEEGRKKHSFTNTATPATTTSTTLAKKDYWKSSFSKKKANSGSKDITLCSSSSSTSLPEMIQEDEEQEVPAPNGNNDNDNAVTTTPTVNHSAAAATAFIGNQNEIAAATDNSVTAGNAAADSDQTTFHGVTSQIDNSMVVGSSTPQNMNGLINSSPTTTTVAAAANAPPVTTRKPLMKGVHRTGETHDPFHDVFHTSTSSNTSSLGGEGDGPSSSSLVGSDSGVPDTYLLLPAVTASSNLHSKKGSAVATTTNKKQQPPPPPRRYVRNCCSICLGSYQRNDQVVWSSNPACHHVFHYDCIMRWLCQRDENLCPMCRRAYVKMPGKHKKEGVSGSENSHGNNDDEDDNDSGDFDGMSSSNSNDEDEEMGGGGDYNDDEEHEHQDNNGTISLRRRVSFPLSTTNRTDADDVTIMEESSRVGEHNPNSMRSELTSYISEGQPSQSLDEEVDDDAVHSPKEEVNETAMMTPTVVPRTTTTTVVVA